MSSIAEASTPLAAPTQDAASSAAAVQYIDWPELKGAAGQGPAPADSLPPPAALPLLTDWRALDEVRIRLQVCVGEIELRIGDLVQAQAGQVFALDRALDAPVDLCVEGQVVARGELVALGERFALRVTELPDTGLPQAD